ncbi:MAG TPA: tetratricopeptide repeat protein [Usitatibacter sp.]|nr:tetratricopeptide repeat protein [Usitatibacter sp.]
MVEGQPAPVGARAFDLLLALIDRRDRVVTKNELLDIVWPGLVVEENNLQGQVSALRKHLGARIVTTIPGRGYRFTLDPEVEAGTEEARAAPRHNLPAQLNRFIGRKGELDDVKALLEHSRLVTLTSVGGTGKTRLCLEVAQALLERFSDGVWFVELAPVADDSRVAQAVAAVLGVHETATSSILVSLGAWARERSALLVLDNCEHVLAGSAEVAKHMLLAAAGLHILASSRESLRLTGETVYPLLPLATPEAGHAPSGTHLEGYDAVSLFVDRATAAKPSFRITDANAAAVATICRRLDGIPLAIELAAARVRALSVESIAARLDDCFALLVGGDMTAAARQQTLHASLDWSHDLLTPQEQAALRRLAVFAGGWTLEAAESVCAGGDVDPAEVLDVLARLVEKSLVEVDAFGERYRLLETVRQYALEKLELAGEARRAKDAHLAFFLELTTAARAHLVGPENTAWMQRLDLELENILAAHRWAGGEAGLRLVSAIKMYCVSRGLHGLYYRLATEALADAPERSAARWLAVYGAGQMAFGLGRYDESRRCLEESVSIAQELGDRQRVAWALQFLGLSCLAQGDLATARGHLQAALAMAREGADDREVAAALTALGQLHMAEGAFDEATRLYEESAASARRLADRESLGVGLLNIAMASHRKALAERARIVLEALGIAAELGSRYIGQSALGVCAGLAALGDSPESAARLYGAAEAVSMATGVRRDVVDESFIAPLIARVRQLLGDRAEALEAAGRALTYDAAMQVARACMEDLTRTG